MAESLTPIFQTLHDSLMVLAPGGWTTVELSFANVGGALKLTQLQTRGEGATTPTKKPELHLDTRVEASRLSDGVTEVRDLLAAQHKAWVPGLIQVQRTTTFADWKLLQADGTQLYFNRLQKEHLDSLLMTDELFALLAGTERAFHDLQQRLEASLGVTVGFSFDPDRSELSLRRETKGLVTVPVQVIGQYMPDAFTWAWGWAFERDRPHTVERVLRVCAPDVTQPGLSALWRASFHCDEGFAWSVAGSIVVSIGARGLFRAELPGGEGVIFFAVMSDLPAEIQSS